MKEKNATWPGCSVSKEGAERRRRNGCTCVGEDDVGDCAEAFVEVRCNRHIHLPTTGFFDTDANHGDEYGGQDGDKTRNGHEANLLQCPWQREDETHNHTRDAKDNRASPVRSDRVHHDGECEDVAAQGEDQEEDLSRTKHLSPNRSGHDLACVGHVVHVGVGEFELTEHVAGIGRDGAEAYDQDDATGGERSVRGILAAPLMRDGTYTARSRRRRGRRGGKGCRGRRFRRS